MEVFKMKTLNKMAILLVFLCSTLAYSQTPVIIATIPVSGSTGTIIVDEDDLKDAFEDEFNNGSTFNSVSVEKLGSTWYLIGMGTMPGGITISAGVHLSVSGGNGTISATASPSLESCVSTDCGSGCRLKEGGCTSCSSSCVHSIVELNVVGELGGFGFQ